MDENLSIPIKLASAANNIKIWNSRYSLLHSYTLDDAPWFESIDWCSDLHSLASITSKGNKVFLSWIETNTPKHTFFLTQDKCTAIKFPNTSSRFIGFGTKVGSLHLYDIKHGKEVKTFQTKDEITCLHFNWNDSYVAAGSVDGSITLHNIMTCQSSAPLTSKYTEAIRRLKFSFLKKAILAASSNDGGVRLWDINMRRLVHSFSEHFTPSTDLCFSPLNEYLLVSVGLDKRINLMDVQAKKVISTTETAVPITSVDFKENGLTIAVGNSRGGICIYDIRKMKEPQFNIKAHETSVQALAFQNTITKSLIKKNHGSTKQDPKLSNKASSTEADIIYSMHTNMTHEVKSQVLRMQQKQSLTHECFSPIRGSFNQSLSNSKVFQSPLNGEVSRDSLQVNIQRRSVISNTQKRKYSLDIFSPVNDLNCEQICKKAATASETESPLSIIIPKVVVENGDINYDPLKYEETGEDKEHKQKNEREFSSQMKQTSEDVSSSKNHDLTFTISPEDNNATYISEDINCQAKRNFDHRTTTSNINVDHIKVIITDVISDYTDMLRQQMQIMHVRNCRLQQELLDEMHNENYSGKLY